MKRHTPMTDREEFPVYETGKVATTLTVVDARFARKLERENARLRKEKQRLQHLLTDRQNRLRPWMLGESYDLRGENDRLREIAARMAAEMRSLDHEFSTLRDYDAMIVPNIQDDPRSPKHP